MPVMNAQASLQSEAKSFALPLHAEGGFDVKNSPVSTDDTLTGTSVGRYQLEKRYRGDLEAVARGEMLGAGSLSSGSAGYVAMEEVTGTLHGRSGSFALQHFGAMHGTRFELRVEIVPGSGTGELAGISGAMSFTNAAGNHSYALDYTLPESQ